jgi:biotin transport system substrate-specific component
MKIIQLSYLGLGVLVIYLSTFIDFEIKNVGIPITGQSLAVLVIVYLLPKKWGLYAVITYVIIGVLGLPVFADAAFGIETIKGNSGGYIYGFIFAAWVITLFKTIKKPFKLINICFGMLLGTLLILLFGYMHLSFRIGTKNAFVYGVQPFIVGGLIKVLVGTFIVWFWNKKFTSI